MRISDAKLYLYVTTALDPGEYRKFFLVELEGEELISGLFHYRLTLKTDDASVDFTQILGQKITVTIELFSGEKRLINGVVTRFIQAESDKYATTYYAELRPWFWELSLAYDSRIYQQMTAVDIIKDVFNTHGFTDFKDKTTATYAEREYCVWYQESAFDFVSRLMEDEGIFYFFEHTDAGHFLVLADDADAHVDCPGQATAALRGAEPEADGLIDHTRFEEQLVTNKFAAEDYNFETPSTDLLTTVDGQTTGGLRIYEYPGRFADTGKGDTVVKLRMDMIEAPRKLLRAESFCRGFTAGYKFTLEKHYRADLNQAWVIRSLSLYANQERYFNQFAAFPASAKFRPDRVTQKPRIYGTQTALVTGKSGEEIWPDQYGRIKVQFHWDKEGQKDENTSCWVRVAQVWAGKAWGTMFIPRIGMEVVVSFLEGDPDRPIVIGTVYNAEQTIPYAQPDNKTQSTIKTNTSKGGGGYNEIRFEDKKDSEEIFIHAQKDKNIVVENNRTTEVLKDDTLTVTDNRSVTVLEKNETLTVEKGDRTVTVTKGKETHSVKGTRDITVEGNETRTDKADFTHTIKGNASFTIDGSLSFTVKGDVTIKSDGNISNDAGMKMSSKAGTELSNEAGTDLKNKAGTGLSNEAGTELKNKGLTVTNEASTSLTNKGSASQTVDGGGMLTLKGGTIMVG